MSVIAIGASAQVYKQFGPHDHAAWEIVLNLEGTGYTRIGEKDYKFEPGSIICQPPGIHHAKYSQEGFKDIFLQPTVFPLARMAEENTPLIFQDDEEKSFEMLISMAHRAYHEKKNNYKLVVDSFIEAMYQLLISWQNDIQEDKDVRHLKKLLIESFTNPELTVTKLLEESPYSRDHLRRRFKRATGQTPGEYLANLRIEYAMKLLTENKILRYSVAEVGVMSGYYDSHYFSRVFKKKTGMTPSEFLDKV